MPDREIRFELPSQIEIAEALHAIPPGPHHDTVRRMATAIDLLREGGWEVEVVSQMPAPPPPALEYHRAGGECLCTTCGSPYRQHPPYRQQEGLGADGQPFLRRLCDGKLVKL